jgi:hypothetical protein
VAKPRPVSRKQDKPCQLISIQPPENLPHDYTSLLILLGWCLVNCTLQPAADQLRSQIFQSVSIGKICDLPGKYAKRPDIFTGALV